jgi:hypothetical protein
MSIVKYKNKKTGAVAVYESTSHYDPVTKQSRPIRKYLGTEDPVTGELIPSSGKRGRKKGGDNATDASNKTAAAGPDYRLLYEEMKSEAAARDVLIKKLEKENRILRLCLARIRSMADEVTHESGAEES